MSNPRNRSTGTPNVRSLGTANRSARPAVGAGRGSGTAEIRPFGRLSGTRSGRPATGTLYGNSGRRGHDRPHGFSGVDVDINRGRHSGYYVQEAGRFSRDPHRKHGRHHGYDNDSWGFGVHVGGLGFGYRQNDYGCDYYGYRGGGYGWAGYGYGPSWSVGCRNYGYNYGYGYGWYPGAGRLGFWQTQSYGRCLSPSYATHYVPLFYPNDGWTLPGYTIYEAPPPCYDTAPYCATLSYSCGYDWPLSYWSTPYASTGFVSYVDHGWRTCY